jgi:hypothetical protein
MPFASMKSAMCVAGRPVRPVQLLATALFVLAASGMAGAQVADELPAEVQAALALRVLGYDRALDAPAGESIVIGLLFRSGQLTGENMQLVQAFSRLKAQTLRGHPVKVVFRAYQGLPDLELWLEREQVKVVYLSPHLPEIAGLQRACASRKLITISPSVEVVRDGTPIGFVLEDGKPKVLVNREAAKTTGMDLDPELIRLARLVR